MSKQRGRSVRLVQVEPGEPVFPLLGGDVLAPMLVSLWAALMAGDREGAYRIVTEIMNQHGERFRRNPDRERASTALLCASEMVRWQNRRQLL